MDISRKLFPLGGALMGVDGRLRDTINTTLSDALHVRDILHLLRVVPCAPHSDLDATRLHNGCISAREVSLRELRGWFELVARP